MNPQLRKFIALNYQPAPAAAVPLKDFVAAFLASLDDEERPAWIRSRVVAELVAAGYALGEISRTQHIGGLAPKNAKLVARDGRLELAR